MPISRAVLLLPILKHPLPIKLNSHEEKWIYNLLNHTLKNTIRSITRPIRHKKNDWFQSSPPLYINPTKLTNFKKQKQSMKLTITHKSGLKKVLGHENLVRWIDSTLIDPTLLDLHYAVQT